MATLKNNLTLLQGTALLTTSLLGSGVFAVPALTVMQSGSISLWAWPLLLVLFMPITLTFATLGSRYPDSSGPAFFIGKAFGRHYAQIAALLFLSVLPVGLPAVLRIAVGFLQPIVTLTSFDILLIQIATLIVIGLLGRKQATSSANVQLIIALLIIVLISLIWFKGEMGRETIFFPPLASITLKPLCQALAIMFWSFIGIEAFAHLVAEFRHPQRDFTKALLIGLILTGGIYWVTTVEVIHFHAYDATILASASLPHIITQLFGPHAVWLVSVIGYSSCFAGLNLYIQSYTRLIWSQAHHYRPNSWLAKLSPNQVPTYALRVIIICCLLATLITHSLQISLDQLMIYANSIFVMIYLLSMLAGIRLLTGGKKVIAAIGVLLCLVMLMMVGWPALYAIIMFGLLWCLLKKVNSLAE